MMNNLPERIEKYIEKVPISGCWIWTGGLKGFGYGNVSIDGKSKRAHRVIYELLRETVPTDKVLDHLCRVRCCVNPDHLEVVTQKINVSRGDFSKRLLNSRNLTKRHERMRANTHCPNGHEYTPDNVYLARGKRECKTCRKNNFIKWKERKHG
jgi:hypothetical protein